MSEELKIIASELRRYNPLADEYKGLHIHKGWANRIDAALSQQPAQPVRKDCKTCGAVPSRAIDESGECYECSESRYAEEAHAKFLASQPAQPSCEPAPYMWAISGSNARAWATNEIAKANLRNPDLDVIPLYAAPPDYEALRAENAQLKKSIIVREEFAARVIAESLEIIEDRDALKARNDELEPAFAKASKACSSALLALAHTSLDNPLYSDAYEEVNAMMPIFMEMRKS